MKKYCETKNVEPFDWNKFIDDAIKTKVSLEQYEHARYLSLQWVTCAVGNQCSIIPRRTKGEIIKRTTNGYDIEHMNLTYNEGQPIDDELNELGLTFHNCIVN
jgi:hypothetical protein